MWKQIVLHKYYKGERWHEIRDVQCCSVSKVWSNIISLGSAESDFASLFHNSFKWSLGSGSNISFWNSVWIGTMPLSRVFPRLFNLSSSKNFCIRDMLSTINEATCWNLAWKRALRGRALSDETELLNLLAGISPNQSCTDQRI